MFNPKYIILNFIFIMILSISAVSYAFEEINFNDAINQYENLDIKMPESEPDGRTQTLNKKGATSPLLDNATLSFIEFGKNKKVLEVGGAYGLVMSKMLKQYPDTTYHINDLDKRHLLIAANYLKNQEISEKILKNKTSFIVGDSAEMHYENEYDAILVARVLHFMNPDELNKTVNNLYNALKPGGRVYVIAITPYVKRYRNFIEEYEKRVARKEEYPGFVRSLNDWLNEDAISINQKKQISSKPFMFLDDKVLSRLFDERGFSVIECKTQGLKYKSDSWSLDGRENVILIAEKQ